jgi:hypothetical protein
MDSDTSVAWLCAWLAGREVDEWASSDKKSAVCPSKRYRFRYFL